VGKGGGKVKAKRGRGGKDHVGLNYLIDGQGGRLFSTGQVGKNDARKQRLSNG